MARKLIPGLKWSHFKIIGLVVGMAMLGVAFAVCLVYHWYRQRRRQHAQAPRVATSTEARREPEEPESELEPASPGPEPSYDTDTVRRTTGHPQTFYDWIQSDNANHMDVYEHRPSVDYSQGPPMISESSSMYSRPVMPQHVTTGLVTPGGDGSVTQGSADDSSFERAVLDAALHDKDDRPAKAGADKETAEEAEPSNRMARGYSGAWP